MSGALGQTVQERTCGACWLEWRDESIRIINHLGLQPADAAHRAQLYDLMRQFLRLE
jgi:Fe-S cluster biosynthesis and repair protein YggX